MMPGGCAGSGPGPSMHTREKEAAGSTVRSGPGVCCIAHWHGALLCDLGPAPSLSEPVRAPTHPFSTQCSEHFM
jgi:hypothetical protein